MRTHGARRTDIDAWTPIPAGWGPSGRWFESTRPDWQPSIRVASLAMAILSVYLRQRGSPKSKPVGSAHHETGAEG
jgi:uncharacterized protein DUF6766